VAEPPPGTRMQANEHEPTINRTTGAAGTAHCHEALPEADRQKASAAASAATKLLKWAAAGVSRFNTCETN
jgi:hypothetical protein